MDIYNTSQLPFLSYEKMSKDGPHYTIVVLKGTYDLSNDEERLILSEEQIPIVFGDIFAGPIKEEPWKGVLQEEGDLLFGKPSTDIQVYGTLYTEHKELKKEWVSTVHVGEKKHSIRLFGPRKYIKQDNEWQLTEPEPCSQLKLDYRLAFGGCYTDYEALKKDQNGAYIAYSLNQGGCGWLPNDKQLDSLTNPVKKNIKAQIDQLKEIKAPQIIGLNDQLTSPYNELYPEGFGPVARWNQTRLKYAGTFDDNWRKNRYPALPVDFDYHFYQAANKGLITPLYLIGNEDITLEGCLAEGILKTKLPNTIPVMELRKNKQSDMKVMPMDTMRIFLDSKKVVLIWRCQIPSWSLPDFARIDMVTIPKSLDPKNRLTEPDNRNELELNVLEKQKLKIEQKAYVLEQIKNTRILTEEERLIQQELMQDHKAIIQRIAALSGENYVG